MQLLRFRGWGHRRIGTSFTLNLFGQSPSKRGFLNNKIKITLQTYLMFCNSEFRSSLDSISTTRLRDPLFELWLTIVKKH